MNVAQTILKQLGGNKFLAMTGAYNLRSGENTLVMNLRRNKSGAKYLTITLTGGDDYIMSFQKLKRGTYDVVEVARYEGVYNDQLQSIFTDVTGMYTHL